MLRIILILLVLSSSAIAEEIGSVSIEFKMIGPDSKLVIEAISDPDIPGVACYVALPRKGGLKGAIGLAENSSDVAISCVQIGKITLTQAIIEGKEDGKEIFQKKSSIFFKKARVARFYDRDRHALVYLSFSKKLFEGAPKSNISVVPIRVIE